MPAIEQFERAPQLNGIVRRNQDQRVIFQGFGERGFGVVIARPLGAARILFVNGLRFGAPFRVQPDLMDVSEHAHDRVGETAAKTLRRLQRQRNRDRRFHHQIAGALTRQIEHGGLPGEEPALGRGNDGRESGAAPRFDAFVVEADFVGGASPRRGTRAILRTAGRLLRAARCAFSACWGSGGYANVGEGSKEARVNSKAFTVDDPRLGWDAHLFPDRRDDAARNDHRGVFKRRPGDRDDFRAANGEILRLATLRIKRARRKQKRKKCAEPDLGRTPENRAGTHATLLLRNYWKDNVPRQRPANRPLTVSVDG